MNGHPENDSQDEFDMLALEYELGSLGAGPRPEVEHHLSHDAELQAAIDSWEQRLLVPAEPALVQLSRLGVWSRIKRWWHPSD
ncbi:hypothetical protein [Pseudomonas auratipiscis]|uniref:Anti-sigma factor n=1 Tax=Pseudomonas auratipiscis TaxID=3115853 RepID=A0AB35WTP8_9PSED|nr:MULTISPECIES: hypothetical protein [unclassified Pseudomonas]MEE1867817.1 hypothetical protein [Pseudomonas sp. 120P]MEE1960319.1 hypothetical protein [Pseudomonas sp. 119P]